MLLDGDVMVSCDVIRSGDGGGGCLSFFVSPFLSGFISQFSLLCLSGMLICALHSTFLFLYFSGFPREFERRSREAPFAFCVSIYMHASVTKCYLVSVCELMISVR